MYPTAVAVGAKAAKKASYRSRHGQCVQCPHKKKSITMSTVGDAKDDARNSRLEELDDKIERLTPTVSPVAGGADTVDELSLGMANASFDDAREELNFPEFLKCHTCLKTTTDDDGVYFEENMWICYPCVYRIRDGEIGSPR